MRWSSDPIEPIRKSRVVGTAPSAAFELFTDGMGSWWPLDTHSISVDVRSLIRFEGWVGGRVVEVTPAGDEHPWAEVLAWDPPWRFALSWHPSVEPVAASVLELRFVPEGDGTRVELEHRGWEEFGAEVGRRLREQYDPGWDAVLERYTGPL